MFGSYLVVQYLVSFLVFSSSHKGRDGDTVLPAKSDSDMFCLQSYQGLIIDRSLV